MTYAARRRLAVISFVAPALLGITVFFVYPLLASVFLSFTRFDLLSTPEWVGLDNYKFMLEDASLRKAAYNTAWLVAVMVPAKVLGALLTGYLLTKYRTASGFYRTVFYLPYLAPPVAATIAFVALFKPGTGPVNAVIEWFGFEGPLWFNDPDLSKPSLTLLLLWGMGDLVVIFLAAMLDVPKAQYEAAELDGANAWHKMRHITLPTISPVILFAVITTTIATLQYFTQAAVAASVASDQATTGGGISSTFGYPQESTFTYPLWLYVVGFRYGAMGYANALAVVLFLVAFSVTVILLRRNKAFLGGAS